MQSQLVFQEEKERERLRRQNLLLSQAEKPALEHFFKGKSELSVLDIGCNDGARTFHRFSDDRISRVIGLEYNQQLVERANSQYGNTKFSFYQMDVDRDSFSADFQKLCTEPEDREFDLICLSFVLMHLHDGEKLLRTLKNFLKKGGVIFITESNDRISTLAWTVSGYLKRGQIRRKKRNRSGRSRLADQLRIRSYPCLVQGDFRCQRRTAAKRRYFPDLFFLFARGCGNLAGRRTG